MKSIWTVGEIIVEIMRPDTEMPHNVPGTYLGPYPSGAPAIMISAAARLGAKTGIIGAVGNDKFGELLIERLEKYGVDCKYIHKSDFYLQGTPL
jgi:sugar/nucleoside kinase (ribokinase family)